MTTDTKPLTPTDPEIVALAVSEGVKVRTGAGVVKTVRAALAKWGTPPAVAPWRSAVLDLIDECPGLTMGQSHWLSRRVKELDFTSAPQPTQPPPAPAPHCDAGEVIDIPEQCPYFGPSPHRDVWLEGWYSACATKPAPASQGCALDVVLDAFENKTRGIPQAHIAAALVAELRAAIDAASTTPAAQVDAQDAMRLEIESLRAAQPAGAQVETAYGATEFGWTDWRNLQDGDKRLKALVVSLFGNDHRAFADLEALIDRAFNGQASAQAAPVRETERDAFKAAHRHLELDEVPDAWGRPVFKHSHVEASWLGWISRAAQPSPSPAAQEGK